ncbi:uncharacterized protein LOC122366527 isoform X1 [Amphibalanus amphitrite]|uniref:uncharacterized protein LOC122366527 isoform X1 n=1 Tax=Amphibalanus amphitrite TaxID=1232801 RepID=UPI001C900C3C|nr:uncharacterized protein LOC122366527 isoform X1 [Amphibalanus amphitrite]
MASFRVLFVLALAATTLAVPMARPSTIEATVHDVTDSAEACYHNGETYEDGSRIEDPSDPCAVRFCVGGSVRSTALQCIVRDDCEPRHLAGLCCPSYDHCASLGKFPQGAAEPYQPEDDDPEVVAAAEEVKAAAEEAADEAEEAADEAAEEAKAESEEEEADSEGSGLEADESDEADDDSFAAQLVFDEDAIEASGVVADDAEHVEGSGVVADFARTAALQEPIEASGAPAQDDAEAVEGSGADYQFDGAASEQLRFALEGSGEVAFDAVEGSGRRVSLDETSEPLLLEASGEAALDDAEGSGISHEPELGIEGEDLLSSK